MHSENATPFCYDKLNDSYIDPDRPKTKNSFSGTMPIMYLGLPVGSSIALWNWEYSIILLWLLHRVIFMVWNSIGQI